MPPVEKHLELSKGRTGKTFKELHEWMDPWSTNEQLARERHDIINIPQNILYVHQTWGGDGVKEFLHHIKDDHMWSKRNIISKILGRIF